MAAAAGVSGQLTSLSGAGWAPAPVPSGYYLTPTGDGGRGKANHCFVGVFFKLSIAFLHRSSFISFEFQGVVLALSLISSRVSEAN